MVLRHLEGFCKSPALKGSLALALASWGALGHCLDLSSPWLSLCDGGPSPFPGLWRGAGDRRTWHPGAGLALPVMGVL